jgi:hypothetical protein
MPGAPAVEAEDEFVEVGLEVLAGQPVLREADRGGQDRRSAWAPTSRCRRKTPKRFRDELADAEPAKAARLQVLTGIEAFWRYFPCSSS